MGSVGVAAPWCGTRFSALAGREEIRSDQRPHAAIEPRIYGRIRDCESSGEASACRVGDAASGAVAIHKPV